MQSPRLTLENVLWGLVLALALGVRLLNLGATPLSDPEANWALQALSLFPGVYNIEPISPGSQPGYLALTGMLFAMFGSSDGLARLVPALAGGLLCLVPYFFRSRIGQQAALIMAFGLALDPGLVAISRLAGGSMLALSSTLLSLGMLASSQAVWAGFFFGLALLGGPAVWQGILILFLTFILERILQKVGWFVIEEEPSGIGSLFAPLPNWRAGLLVALGTFLLVGTLFGSFLQGLGAASASLPEFLRGWATPQVVTISQMLVVLLVYQPLAIIFGLIGAVRAWLEADPTARRLSLWMLVALAISLIYPARQVSDLVWVLIPLWGLAAIELGRYFKAGIERWWLVLGEAALVFILLSMVWLNLAGLSQPIPDQGAFGLRIAVMIGLLLLVGLVIAMMGFGGSWTVAWQGLVLGVVAALGIFQLAGVWSSSHRPSSRMYAIWNPAPQSGDNRLLMETVDDLSNWSTGMSNQIDVTIAVDAPSLRWAFRSYPRAVFIPEQQVLSLRQSPSIVITRVTAQEPSLSASYRGQDFAWWRYPGWQGAMPQPFPAWVAYRENPAVNEQVILWARADLFPAEIQTAVELPAQPEIPEIPLEEDIPQ
jgi:hypothetical protein